MTNPKCSRCGKEVEKCSDCKESMARYIRKYGRVYDAPIRCKEGKFHYCEDCVLKQINADIEWREHED